MSRVGKAPITLGSNVQFSVEEGNIVKVKGPKGELSQAVHSDINVKMEDGIVVLEKAAETKELRAMHGLYRALINNMVTGVTDGYTKTLELVGVGYRASAVGQRLTLALGFSHPIVVELPNEVKVTAETKKGENPMITLESHDKQLIGQIAAKLRSFRKPEPYKGKGVRFKGEIIRRKAGKSAGK
jgi:large subunit ribosomal protein L6